MKTFNFATDSEMGQIEASDICEALAEIAPTEELVEIAGAWAWVEDPETGEREYVGQENMP